MEPGELEVVVVPYVEGTVRVPGGDFLRPYVLPFVEASARVGLLHRLDMQLKIDPTIIPEVSLAYQLLGDPATNDLAFTIGIGVKPTLLPFPFAATLAGLIVTPVQAIVDVPIAEGVTAVIGARALPAVLFSGNYASYKIAPGGFLAVHIDAGPFFIRPELAMNGVVPLGASHDTTTGGFGNTGDGNLNLAIGLGIGGTIDFGRAEPTVAASPDVTLAGGV